MRSKAANIVALIRATNPHDKAMNDIADLLEKHDRVVAAARARLNVWSRETFIEVEAALKALDEE